MRPLAPRPGWPWLAFATLTAAGAAAAAGYALTAPKHYTATAQLLVAPVGDPAFTGIDVLRDSSGRRTAAASAAALARGPLVADAVRALLGLRRSRDALLASLTTRVVDSSDVVDITVDDTSAVGAAQIANAFADTLVNQRTATFQSDVVAAVRRYAGLVQGMTPEERSSAAGAELERRLAVLQAVQGRPDPSIRHAGQATAPTSASSSDVATLVGLGAGAGAAAGLVLGLVLLALGRRRRDGLAETDATAAAADELVGRVEERLAARESAFAARERDLRRAIDELRRVQTELGAAAAEELADRERLLDERVAAVTNLEAELARRAAEEALRAREPEPEPEPELEPAPPPAARGRAGTFTIHGLERIVDERGSEFPDRVDDWTATLFYLREYAGPDGAIPGGFDGLVAETFHEILE